MSEVTRFLQDLPDGQYENEYSTPERLHADALLSIFGDYGYGMGGMPGGMMGGMGMPGYGMGMGGMGM